MNSIISVVQLGMQRFIKEIFKKPLNVVILILIVIAILDASSLTIDHYSKAIVPCIDSAFVDCGKVLSSQYAEVMGIPLALLGVFHYSAVLLLFIAAVISKKALIKRFVFLFTAVGTVVSMYLVFLQLVVIQAICLYCMLSALISFILYPLVRFRFKDSYQEVSLLKTEFLYKMFLKPIFFAIDPEFVHEKAFAVGSFLGSNSFTRNLFAWFFKYENKKLKQKIVGITFANPVGLSAGYDYEAKFVDILPSIGFGFETIGTITNQPYEGNEKPRLGRLPKSQSLLVNKGFRNEGIEKIIDRLKGRSFAFPVGLSIGRTNTEALDTQKKAIDDIIQAFKKAEKAKLKLSFYELNISCPNLKGNVTFYTPKNLEDLLKAVKKLKLSKPVFIKMPIEKTDREVRAMLDIIVRYPIAGVIFGNLQKDRKDSSFVKEEIRQAGKGNFSGKPTWKRSNELIKLAYKHYGKKLIIIGTGGIFTAEDAYTKIKLGASLVQLITGMIFEGPQRIAQINRGLVRLLEKDGYKNITEAVGVDNNEK